MSYVKPDSTNTGPRLTSSYGDVTITAPGTKLSNLDIYGFVTIKTSNVTLDNVRVRGSGPGKTDTGLVTCIDASVKNLVLTNVLLVPDYPSQWIDGVMGHDFTAENVEIYNTVDGLGVFNTHGPANNVVVQGCFVHDHVYFPDDTEQKDGSHNDCVQVQGGSNTVLRGNTFSAAASGNPVQQQYGAGVTISPNVSAVSGLVIDNNWISGGQAGVQSNADPYKGGTSTYGSITNNVFSVVGKFQPYQIRYNKSIKFTVTGNTYTTTDPAIPASLRGKPVSAFINS